jgi:GH15 family glucan-1,4-alpha-glucosidase
LVEDGEITYDATLDNAAIFSSFMFGLFAGDSHEMKASIKAVEETFGTSTDTPGLPRYENDPYRRRDESISGNWWYITTLWKAQYDIENGNLDAATATIEWIHDHMISTGMMGEKIDPRTHEIIAPAPLTWSHAEYISTLIDLIGRER